VTFPAFKAGDSVLRGSNGGFDFHTPPPTMARLTLARKIAAITLIVWKKGASFDANHLKQAA